MTRPNILTQMDYTIFISYMLKVKVAKTREITENLNFKDRRSITKKIKKSVDKNFITNIEGKNKGAVYQINIIGLFNYWLQNYLPMGLGNQYLLLINNMSQKNQLKTLDNWEKALQNHIISFDLVNTYEENEQPIPSIHESLERLTENILLDGLVSFTNKKGLLPIDK